MIQNIRYVILMATTLFTTTHLTGATDTVNAVAPTTKEVIQSKDAASVKGSDDNPITKEDITKASEAFGHFIGRNLKSPAIEFNIDEIIKGIRSGAAGEPAPMPDKDYEKLMAKIQSHAVKTIGKDNLTAANQFLEKNAKENGVIVIEAGKLQYKTLKEGTGPVVGPHSTPTIKYTGKFIDGTVFGSSDDAGGPVTVPLDHTIQGFSLGIAGMKEGEERRLFIHPDLGYGTSEHLPPNSLLIFDIDVVKSDIPHKSATEDEHDSEDEDDDEDADVSPHATTNPKTPKTSK